ncbi:helix-turn-helix domain-containing protein [Streptomyces cylindrosporus]|uniref:Helix-turn-helix domain-containing protein n=1 Tax=Streptomyces cylindrosporus TaxID=2927583 RepID=A0ABS9Y4M6_9ACTN|nr:helix-turn-helix domain-containing protein [Streptomyces cylindrosporus]MCI3272177.1 helix-turn-helix domain-containing protein [Streptomyces cylindrosporus]
MDTQNPSAPSRAQSRIPGENHPHAGGLIHDHTRHTTRFTIIGNHLAQHPSLSGLAIGLAVYIQSLPQGVRVDIKTLADRFPEGRDRIAAALRELETHGYLRRERERIHGGRIVTRTISCNQPGRSRDDHARHSTSKPARPKKSPPRALPPVPRPSYPAPALIRQATDLLADLHRHDRRLLLSERDAAHLAPGVAAWLERDVTPTAVRESLTADLPAEPLCRPAALLAHRLTDRLPPLPLFRPPSEPPTTRHPLQNCNGCDRAYRAPHPGHCRDCRTDDLRAPLRQPIGR